MRFAIWERSRKVVNLYINIKVKFTIGAVDCWNKTTRINFCEVCNLGKKQESS